MGRRETINHRFGPLDQKRHLFTQSLGAGHALLKRPPGGVAGHAECIHPGFGPGRRGIEPLDKLVEIGPGGAKRRQPPIEDDSGTDGHHEQYGNHHVKKR